MNSLVALVVASAAGGLVIVGTLLMNPAMGEAYFAAFWWAMTVIVMLISLGFIMMGMGEAPEEPPAPEGAR